jgi:hypothetical protein
VLVALVQIQPPVLLPVRVEVDGTVLRQTLKSPRSGVWAAAVTAFDPRDRDLGADAFRLMLSPAVTLFWRMALPDRTATWLERHGDPVVRIRAARWS